MREEFGIEQFKFGLAPATAAVFVEEKLIWKFGLGIFVEHAHVAVRGRRVEIEVALFHVFAVIALIAGEAEEPFFEDGIAAVPQREAEAHHLVTVADSADAVFAPTISTRTGVVVRKILPGRAVGAVVFANRAPLALGKIRAPALPMFLACARFFQAMVFGRGNSWHEQ